MSIGIENVAAKASELTQSQLSANIELVKFLSERYPSIKYLIGHDEYNDLSQPHYQLFKSLDSTYQPYDKPDPGEKFMYDLRLNLKEGHGLEFLK